MSARAHDIRLCLLGCALLVATVDGCSASGSGPTNPSGSPSASAGSSKEEACIAAAGVRPKPKSGQPDSVTASHILVKHASSKNPREGVTRTRGEACLRAAEARDKIVAGASFDEMVSTYSDEAGAPTRAGSVGEVKRDGGFDAAFVAAALDLDRGQMSDIVETPFGFHLILRKE